MHAIFARVLSLVIAIGYAAAMIVHTRGLSVDILEVGVARLLPLALIWFPDTLGSLTGYVGRDGKINTETPPILVSLAGWFFLVGLPMVIYFLH